MNNNYILYKIPSPIDFIHLGEDINLSLEFIIGKEYRLHNYINKNMIRIDLGGCNSKVIIPDRLAIINMKSIDEFFITKRQSNLNLILNPESKYTKSCLEFCIFVK